MGWKFLELQLHWSNTTFNRAAPILLVATSLGGCKPQPPEPDSAAQAPKSAHVGAFVLPGTGAEAKTMGFADCSPTTEGMSCAKNAVQFFGIPAIYAKVDLNKSDKASGISAYSYKSIELKMQTQIVDKSCQEKIKSRDPKSTWNDVIDDSCISTRPIESLKAAMQAAGWLKDPQHNRRLSVWLHATTPAVITISNDGGITIQWDTNAPARHKEATAFVATAKQRDASKDNDIEMMRK